jgi:hypothetical protein
MSSPGSGGEDFRRLAARLEGAADHLPRVVEDAIAAASTQPIRAARARAAATLPRRGGLAGEVARSRMTIRRVRSRRRPGVRIEATSGEITEQLALIDRGAVLPPTYGRWGRRKYQQPVRRGWFTDPMRDSRAAMAAAIMRALREALHR